jgi:hypothetical protein
MDSFGSCDRIAPGTVTQNRSRSAINIEGIDMKSFGVQQAL